MYFCYKTKLKKKKVSFWWMKQEEGNKKQRKIWRKKSFPKRELLLETNYSKKIV